MAANLILQQELAQVGNKRNYEKFLALINSKAQVEQPLRTILQNAEALDFFKIPTGNVLTVAISAPLVGELVNRQPFEAVAVWELPANNYTEASLKESLQTYYDQQMNLAKDLPMFSLTNFDADHWEASIKNATISVMRVKGKANWSGHALKNGVSTAITSKPSSSSFLEASLKHDVPNYSYALVVSSVVEPELMNEYVGMMEKSCQTVGEMARHPTTLALQNYIQRNTNRIMLSVAEHMKWDIPVQVDSASCYSSKHQADYAAPLMARPDHLQLNNGIVLEKDVVHLFNGAIQIAQPNLKYAVVNLGYNVGMGMFTLAADYDHASVAAMPTSVRRQALDAYQGSKIASAAPIVNIKSFIGQNLDSIRFREGFYEPVNDQFLATCQKQAGQSSVNLDLSASGAPMILAPVVTVVGPSAAN